ncbi:3-hydroxyacyl-ACP dehydratase [soil metagenome]
MVLKDFYEVQSSHNSEGSYTTSLRINKDHEIYNGHFPGRPVTPGVILMQLFKEEVERLCNKTLSLEIASNVKFMAVVDPNLDDILIFKYDIEQTFEKISLKGVAENNKAIALKFNAVYKIIK